MQAHVSLSLSNFQDNFFKKYGLFEYTRRTHPAVFIGLYNDEDWMKFLTHSGRSTVVFQGMDCKDLTGLTANLIKRKRARVICISHWQSETLTNLGVQHELIPVSATIANGEYNASRESSEHVYFYSSDLSPESAAYYGEHMIEEIKSKISYPVIRATYNTFHHESLTQVYKDCFVTLRLTTYDGLPNGVLEAGLWGRRSIFNGLIPHSIAWKDVDDICRKIDEEYKNRDKDNSKIHSDILNYVNLPNNLFKYDN